MKTIYLFDEKGKASEYGIGTYIQNLIEICQELEFRVFVILLSGEGDVRSYESKVGVQYLEIPFPVDIPQNDDKEQLKLYFDYVVSVLQPIVSFYERSIFHLNYTQYCFLAEGLKKCWPMNKIILTVHYFSWCFDLMGNVSQLCSIVNKEEALLSEKEKRVIYSGLFEQKLFQVVDRIICLSNFAEQVLVNYYEISSEKIHVFENGIKDEYVDKSQKSILRRRYLIPTEEKMILFVGRLHPAKGLNYLLEAFKIVAKKEPYAHLYIVGSGDIANALFLSDPIWRRITFCGKLKKEQVRDFYKMSDIGVLPSLNEQCSYSVIEMMMFGMPILGTNSTGLDEMIDDGINGHKIHLIEKEDQLIVPVDDIVSKLLLILGRSDIDKLSIASRSKYEEKYKFEYLLEKMKLLYFSEIESMEV